MTGCTRHKYCAYTGTERELCPICHATDTKCSGRHGGRPVDGWDERCRGAIASATHKALRAGQYIDPKLAARQSCGLAQLHPDPSTITPTNPQETAA